MGDRATGLDFLGMIEHRYSPSFRSSIDNGVDKKLREVSLREHFPEVSNRLEQLLKDLEDYDSKYIELATRIKDYLLKSSITTTDRVGTLTKVATYVLLDVPRRWLDGIQPQLGAGELIMLEKRLEDMSSQNQLLIDDLKNLSDKIKKEGDALVNDLEDLLKRPTLKSACRYCPPSLKSLLLDS